jgi:hypothetical protein
MSEMIRVQDFIGRIGNGPGEADYAALDALVDAFARKMKLKLKQKADEGRYGWDDPEEAAFLEESLYVHVHRAIGDADRGKPSDPRQYVDCANIAAMLWNLGQGSGRPSREEG